MTTKQRVDQIRKAREFSKTLGGDVMPSEIAIDDLLAEIERLTALGAEANARLREVEKEAQDKWFAQETEIERLRARVADLETDLEMRTAAQSHCAKENEKLRFLLDLQRMGPGVVAP